MVKIYVITPEIQTLSKHNRKIVSRQNAKNAKENQFYFVSIIQLETALLSVLCVLARVKLLFEFKIN